MFIKQEKIFISILFIFFVFIFGITLCISVRMEKNNEYSLISNIAEAKIINIGNEEVLGLPFKLIIPSIKVNSNIDPVGLTKDGAMDLPLKSSNTGWYNLGPIPGVIGSSVIDGHSGFKNGAPAVFDNLHKIKIGDKVTIINNKGNATIFIVHKISKYDFSANATNIFTSTDGKIHLNLITCTGTWNSILKSHNSRLVVFTDKE